MKAKLAKRMLGVLSASVGVLLGCVVQSEVLAAGYTVTTLGVAEPWALNNQGVAVGIGPRLKAGAFVEGRFVNYGQPQGTTQSLAYAVNRRNVAAGWAAVHGGIDQAAIFTFSTATLIPYPSGTNSSFATGINDSGTVIFYASEFEPGVNNPELAFLAHGTSVTPLGTIDGGNLSHPLAINSAGRIVGYSATLMPDGVLGSSVAFVYENGNMSVPAAASGYSQSTAYAINDSGWIAGTGTNTSGQTEDWLQINGVKAVLPYPPGSSSVGNIIALNNAGQVLISDADGNLFVYDNGTFVNVSDSLKQAGIPSFAARAMNDKGQILGANGNYSILLTPIE